MNGLLEKVRMFINNADGTCIALNGKLIDSDNIVAINNERMYVHFTRHFKDIDVMLNNIKDIKFDFVGAMTIAILYLTGEKVVSIHCLP